MFRCAGIFLLSVVFSLYFFDTIGILAGDGWRWLEAAGKINIGVPIYGSLFTPIYLIIETKNPIKISHEKTLKILREAGPDVERACTETGRGAI